MPFGDRGGRGGGRGGFGDRGGRGGGGFRGTYLTVSQLSATANALFSAKVDVAVSATVEDVADLVVASVTAEAEAAAVEHLVGAEALETVEVVVDVAVDAAVSLGSAQREEPSICW